MSHPLQGQRGHHGRARKLSLDELMAVHERLQRLSVRFWESGQGTVEAEWRQRVVGRLEQGNFEGALAELELMRGQAPCPPDAVLIAECPNERCRKPSPGDGQEAGRSADGRRQWPAEFWIEISGEGDYDYRMRDSLQDRCPACGTIAHIAY